MMSYAAMGVVVIQFVLVGYSWAFGPDNPVWGDFRWGGLNGVFQAPNPDYGPTVPHLAYMNFQMMFAVITPALISGSIVERMSFKSYLIFIALWTSLCYDPLAHWMWSAFEVINADGSCSARFGWLRQLGAIDFAGGTVIHISSGFSAFVAAMIVGKRRNIHTHHRPANVPFVLLGAAFLWFGWLGFNGGSAVAANGPAVVAATNTSIAAASSFLTWICLDLLIKKKSSAVGAATGAVVGMVVITPASGFILPGFSIILGVVGTSVVYSSLQLKRFIPVDDSLDVFFSHGIGGVVGALMTGLFASTDVNPNGFDGAFYGNPRLLGVQLLAVTISITLASTVTAGLLLIMKFTVGLRADKDDDALDALHHGEDAFEHDYLIKALEEHVKKGGDSPVYGTDTPRETRTIVEDSLEMKSKKDELTLTEKHSEKVESL